MGPAGTDPLEENKPLCYFKRAKNNNKTEQRTQLLLLLPPCFVFFVFFEEDENSNKKIDIISNKLIPFKKYIFIPANGPPKTVLL